MDIYKQYVDPQANDRKTVNVGRISAAVALLIAVIIAPMLGGLDQAFQYIQEYTGVVSPGILAVFLLGLFWKKTTNRGAIFGVLASIPIAMYFKVAPNGWSDNPIFVNIPFMDQMGWTAILTMVVIMITSWTEGKGKDDAKAIPLNRAMFRTSPQFNIGAFVIMIILSLLYALLWN